MNRIAQAARAFIAMFMAMLREIFDEAGYARFLRRAQLQPSREAYAAFRREREAMTSRRPRCC